MQSSQYRVAEAITQIVQSAEWHILFIMHSVKNLYDRVAESIVQIGFVYNTQAELMAQSGGV